MPHYAGFFVRLWAYIIDLVIIWAGLSVVRLIMSGIMSALSGTPFEGGILFQYTLKDIVLYVFQVLYFILMTYYTGTTLGKKLLNLQVVNEDGSDKLKLMDVLFRETIGRFVCNITMCIGYIIVGVDKENRGFHDMIADTRVVYGKRIKIYPVYASQKKPPYNPKPNYNHANNQPPQNQPPQNSSPYDAPIQNNQTPPEGDK